jgi:hypothetical protein
MAAVGNVSNATCFGAANGSATAVASGGVSPYSYSWNTTPVQTIAAINNLVAGSYIVTATDANGCIDTQQITITQPASLNATATVTTPLLCFGNTNGYATATATGGTAPYSYAWNTTPVQTTALATGMGAGTYIVTVTDARAALILHM